MRVCFSFGLALAFAATGAAADSSAPRLASVVRADPRTGRLVRTLVAPPGHRVSKVMSESVSKDVERIATLYEVDPLLVRSVIEVESNFNPLAVSPKGARGMMQLMPGTARQLDVKNSFDALQNIEGGVRHLKHLLTIFGDKDPRLALAAYNAGEGAVIRHGGVPPYKETAEYVNRVGQKYGAARQAAEQAKPKPAAPAPTYQPIEQYIDSEGRLHLRTRPAP